MFFPFYFLPNLVHVFLCLTEISPVSLCILSDVFWLYLLFYIKSIYFFSKIPVKSGFYRAIQNIVMIIVNYTTSCIWSICSHKIPIFLIIHSKIYGLQYTSVITPARYKRPHKIILRKYPVTSPENIPLFFQIFIDWS